MLKVITLGVWKFSFNFFLLLGWASTLWSVIGQNPAVYLYQTIITPGWGYSQKIARNWVGTAPIIFPKITFIKTLRGVEPALTYRFSPNRLVRLKSWVREYRGLPILF